MKEYSEKIKIDVHCHLFDINDVTNKYLEMRFGSKFFHKLARFLHYIIPFSDTDFFDKLKAILDIGQFSTEEIFDKFKTYYSENFIFTPLMMDIAYGTNLDNGLHLSNDNSNDGFYKQIEKLRKLKSKYKNQIFPFLAVDPRRENIEELLKKEVGENKLFLGIKIYSPLGYLPSHPVLMRIYDYCVKYNIPVTAHCSEGGIATINFNPLEVKGIMLVNACETEVNFKKWFFPYPFKQRSRFFAKPQNWIPVLKRFPKLKLNLAHFGGTKHFCDYIKGKKHSWTYDIISLMHEYKNVYADLSSTFYNIKFFPKLKKLIHSKIGDKLLYGSDFYLNILKKLNFKDYISPFYSKLNEDEFNKIAVENPQRFLFK